MFFILVSHNSSHLFLFLWKPGLQYIPCQQKDGLLGRTCWMRLRNKILMRKKPFRLRFRPLCAAQLHCLLENFHVHVVLTHKHCNMFWKYLHRAQSSRNFPGIFSVRHRTSLPLCRILFCCFLNLLTHRYVWFRVEKLFGGDMRQRWHALDNAFAIRTTTSQVAMP